MVERFGALAIGCLLGVPPPEGCILGHSLECRVTERPRRHVEHTPCATRRRREENERRGITAALRGFIHATRSDVSFLNQIMLAHDLRRWMISTSDPANILNDKQPGRSRYCTEEDG